MVDDERVDVSEGPNRPVDDHVNRSWFRQVSVEILQPVAHTAELFEYGDDLVVVDQIGKRVRGTPAVGENSPTFIE